MFEAARDTGLAKALRAARIPASAPSYIRYTAAAALAAAVIWAAMHLLLNHLGLSVRLLGVIPDTPSRLILLAAMVAVAAGTAYVYPFLAAQGRRNRIEADLPYAVTYMQALSTTMTLYDTIRHVYLQTDLFGEVSRECAMIVRNVEAFGDDLMSAMRSVQQHTPSPTFSEFLNDLILLAESGGSITEFFAARARYFRETAAREMEMNLKTTEIMAEVYVTAFVAGPIVAMIIIVAQQLSGSPGGTDWMPMIFLGIPAGAVSMIAILGILFPSEKLEIQQSIVREQEYFTDLAPEAEGADIGTYSQSVRFHRILSTILLKLKDPFRQYITNYQWGALFGMIAGFFVVWLILEGYFLRIAPGLALQTGICIAVIAAVAPIALAYEGRAFYIRHLEKQIPEFLRSLADMKDIGMTIQSAIHRIARSHLGLLSSELRVVSAELQTGSILSSSLARMEERIGVVSVKRAISLVIRASEVTDSIQAVLMIAISDFENYLKVKRERYASAFTYVAIVYLSFGVFLYTAYQLNVSFLATFSDLATISVVNNVHDMYWLAILLGGFSGVMAGQLSVNNPLAGLKHTIVFLGATVVAFVVVIGGAI